MAQLVKHLCQHEDLNSHSWHSHTEIGMMDGTRLKSQHWGEERRIPGPCCLDSRAEFQVRCRDHASKTKGRMIEEDTQCCTLASTWIPHPQMTRSYLLTEV